MHRISHLSHKLTAASQIFSNHRNSSIVNTFHIRIHSTRDATFHNKCAYIQRVTSHFTFIQRSTKYRHIQIYSLHHRYTRQSIITFHNKIIYQIASPLQRKFIKSQSIAHLQAIHRTRTRRDTVAIVESVCNNREFTTFFTSIIVRSIVLGVFLKIL